MPTRGFSSLKFIPGKNNEIIALKSEEIGDKMVSFILIFDINGKIILPETKIGDEK
jgi:soluble calcium-activated nucleotidase 1